MLQKKLAGKDWVKGFRKRHPEITLRSPEATSSARAQAFNRYLIKKIQHANDKKSKTSLKTLQILMMKILMLNVHIVVEHFLSQNLTKAG